MTTSTRTSAADTTPTATRAAGASRFPFAPLALSLLTLFFGAVNWHWLRANVVTYGWDRMDHLITSLAYNNNFQNPSPASLFNALTFADYYPPLFHFGVVAAYKVFGVDEDVAAMTNVLYLALLLGATWYVGRRVGGTPVAAVAAVVLGTFPMIFIMSRYLYLDFALTALVAVSLALLLATERFTRRVPSLWFGVVLGLSFLVKWTAAAFLAAPLLYMLWQSGVLLTLVRHPIAMLRPNWKRLGIAALISALLMSAWLVPAWAQVQAHPLGVWLWVVFTLLGTFGVYALLPRGTSATEAVNRVAATRVANALGAGALGAFVMALWYLLNPEFIAGFFYTAYGREEGRFLAFDKYLYEATTEQMGLFYTAVLVVVVLVWGVRRLRRATGGTAAIVESTPSLAPRVDTLWILALWAIVPYIIFSAGVSLAHSRFLMPFLPPFAVVIAAGLWQFRTAAVRVAATALVLLLAFGQFALLSFDSLAQGREVLVVNTPVGAVNLLAHGFFIQYATSGDTDPSYAIADDILERAEQTRLAAGRESINLGVLVNSHQLHEKHFLYQIYIRYPHVRLRELARNWSDQPAYAQLFEMEYVLLSDTHSYRTDSQSQVVLDRLLYDENDLFNQAFQPVQTWNFLSGENVTLYERRFVPTTPGVAVEDYQAVVQAVGDDIGAGDALALVAPDQAYMAGLTFPDGTGAAFLPLATLDALTSRADAFQRIFLLAHNEGQGDPNGEIEGWLRGNFVAGSDQWFGAVRMMPFVRATLPDSATLPLDAQWSTTTRLAGAAVAPSETSIAVRLFWESPDPAAQKVSVQVLAADGALVAQQDADLRNGTQDFALLLPRTTDPAAYRLVVALYDPTTLERYLLTDGGDVVEIGN